MNESINVLLLSAYAKGSSGGIATWTDTYLKFCESQKISCGLVNIAQIGKRGHQRNARRNFVDEYIRTRNIWKELKNRIRYNKYDVAHVNSSCGSFGIIRDYICIRKIKKCGIGTILQFHCDISFQIRNRISKYFLKKAVAYADEIFVLCDNSANYLKRNFGRNSSRIPNFVEESIIRRSPKKINEHIETVLFVGNIHSEKGIKEIYEIAEHFQNKQFLLVGDLHSNISAWKCPQNVRILGRKEKKEVISLLDKADLFLFPTHSEGFSLALAEAMARGVPVITTNVGANLDMIEKQGGIVVEVGDISGMLKAFQQMESKNVRIKMSKWECEKVRNSYTAEEVMRQMFFLYNINIKKGSD